jgi:nucleotide-binding universal stress UspA family protein
MRGDAEPKSIRKVVLAVDPSDLEQDAAPRIGQSLDRLFGAEKPEVQPVFVMTPASAPLPSRWFDDAVPKLKEEATERLCGLLGTSPVSFARPEVIVEYRSSPHAIVERLNEYVRLANAGLVAVPVVRKARFRRLLLGSFSEAMLFESEVPMLSINADDLHAAEGRRRCLAAIDASSESHMAFADQVVDFAKSFDFDIIFLYAMQPKPNHATRADAPMLLNPRALVSAELDDEQKRAMDQLEDVVRRAESRRNQATSRLILSWLTVPRAIMHAANAEGAGLIAVASQSTPLRSLVSRSIARDIIRASPIPVWTLSKPALLTKGAMAPRSEPSRAAFKPNARRAFRPYLS